VCGPKEDFGVLRLDAAFMGAGLLAPTIAAIFPRMKKRPKQNQDAHLRALPEKKPVAASLAETEKCQSFPCGFIGDSDPWNVQDLN